MQNFEHILIKLKLLTYNCLSILLATEDEMVVWHHHFNGHNFDSLKTVKDRETWHTAVHGVTKN